jgi:hypothetical protein
MEKTIEIDGKKILFKTNGAIPLRYKAQFGRDYLKDILKMAPIAQLSKAEIKPENLEGLDFDVLYNVAWTMAKTADPTIPEPLEWLGNFEEFPIMEIFPDLQELLMATLQSSNKKKVQAKKVTVKK